MEQAKEYGRLVTRKGSRVSVCRIRLYDGHSYNWHRPIVYRGMVNIPTDQTYDLDANSISRPHYYDEVWLVRVYKKPWYLKLLFWR